MNSTESGDSPQTVLPTNYSPAFSEYRYRSLTGPILEPALRQIDAIGGDTVQPHAARVAETFLAQRDRKYVGYHHQDS